MKRSGKVEIALVAGLALAGCGRRQYDPCAPQTFNADACQEAIAHNGYYYGGHWYSHSYSGGYTHYYNDYYSYMRSGGNIRQIPPSEWARPASAGADTHATSGGSSGVSRGVFGSSAHGGGAS